MGYITHLTQEAHGPHRSLEKTVQINLIASLPGKTCRLPTSFLLKLSCEHLHLPSPKDALCQVWLKLAQWFWRRRFYISSMYFHHFVIISPWKRARPFIWRNLNPIHPRMFCAQFGWNWLSGSGDEDFLISSMYFHSVSYTHLTLPTICSV